MLLGNYDSTNSNPGRAVGGVSNLYKNYKPGGWYSFYDPDRSTTRTNKKASLPTGTQPPYSWILAPSGGELSSTNKSAGSGSLSISSLSMGKAIASNISGTGTISAASLSLITSLAATIDGISSIAAPLKSTVNMAANLIGSGSVVAGLKVLAGCIASLTGTGTVVSNLKGTSSLQSTIYVNQGSADVADMAAGVWNSVAASYNDSGTMGEKLNAAGTAGDPWTTDLSTYTTDGTAGKIVSDVNKNTKLTKNVILSQ